MTFVTPHSSTCTGCVINVALSCVLTAIEGVLRKAKVSCLLLRKLKEMSVVECKRFSLPAKVFLFACIIFFSNAVYHDQKI